MFGANHRHEVRGIPQKIVPGARSREKRDINFYDYKTSEETELDDRAARRRVGNANPPASGYCG